jgi:hypothetical protein
MSLEDMMAYIDSDELLEVTPLSLRLRKRYLLEHERKKYRRQIEDRGTRLRLGGRLTSAAVTASARPAPAHRPSPRRHSDALAEDCHAEQAGDQWHDIAVCRRVDGAFPLDQLSPDKHAASGDKLHRR